jgi:tRNA1(Val) A37 N6-methylase TrmN6
MLFNLDCCMSQETTKNNFAWLDSALALHQPVQGHRFGTDTALLAACAPPALQRGKTALNIVDLGAGVGTVGLLVAKKTPHAQVFLVENQPDLCALATQNICENLLENRVTLIREDILAQDFCKKTRCAHPPLSTNTVDAVYTNPPYLAVGCAQQSPDPLKAAAHTMPQDGLEKWVEVIHRLLRPQGLVFAIHRVDHLPDMLALLQDGFGNIRLKMIHPFADKSAHRFLICAQKGSRAPLHVAPPLVLHTQPRVFTPEAHNLHNGTTTIDFGAA